MKKLIGLFLCVMTIFLVTGCVTNTVEVIQKYDEKTKYTPDGKEIIAELQGENYCIYLFGVIPVLSGRTSFPNAKQYKMWQNTARDPYVKMMMNWYATNVLKGTGTINYSSTTDLSGAWTLWIISKKRLIAHATAVK